MGSIFTKFLKMLLRALLKSKTYQTIIIIVAVLISFSPCFSKSLKDNSTRDLDTLSRIPARPGRSIAEEIIFRRTISQRYRRRTRDKFENDSICHVPKLAPFLPEVMEYDITSPTSIQCPWQDYVKCYLSKCRVVDEERIKGLSDFYCIYRDIISGPANYYYYGHETVIKGTGEYTLNASDYVQIHCKISANHSKKATWWKGHGWGLRSSFKVPEVPKDMENAINVVMFGFDSVSHNHFIRKLPKSYEYLKNVINATFLNGYNVVGDNTFPAILSLLSGKAEHEMPEKVIKNREFIDHKLFIFHKIKKYGYRTAYFDDLPWASTFLWNKHGFREDLADHYAEAFYQAVNYFYKTLRRGRCIGDTPSHKLMMNVTDQILQMEGKKFVFAFSGQVSHDNINMVGAADNDLVAFLKRFLESGYLDNTLLVVFSDHGPRFAQYRNTLPGRLEQRLPLMAIRLPEILRQRRPEAQAALESNIDVLTTSHDVHATLLDAMDLRELWNPYKVSGARYNRALTLLKQVPVDRSCRDADIDPHWCSCQKWTVVPQSDPMYERVGRAFVDAVNNYTEDQRSICITRELKSIDWVMQSISQESRYVNYDVKLTLNPKHAIFEATLNYDKKLNRFISDIDQISRTNAYGDESHCVLKLYPHLLKLCYCRDNYINV